MTKSRDAIPALALMGCGSAPTRPPIEACPRDELVELAVSRSPHERAVACDLIVLDRLRRRDHGRIARVRILMRSSTSLRMPSIAGRLPSSLTRASMRTTYSFVSSRC